MEYVNLIIDNSNDNTDMLYTYASEIDDLKPGDKVTVPFAKGNKVYDAYVHSMAEGPDPRIKEYKHIISKDPLVSLPSDAVEVSEFMRQRYFCRYIDAIKCFAPVGAAAKRKPRKDLFEGKEVERVAAPTLTPEQQEAVERIKPYLQRNEHKVFLVHGVTSSGKTETYIKVIEECLKRQRTAIMLVPEISLTTQTIQRFQQRFGTDDLAVLHSKLSKGERYDQWMRIKSGEAKVVIGARSAVFAPVENLGAVILDEEHESTYKSDMTPKYDTLEIAVRRARRSGGVVLLGSATPSLTSAFRANKGEYEKILLKKRYNKVPLPLVDVVDMREELKQGNKSIFSVKLYAQIRRCLDEGRQAILFLNRRGYSTFLSCRSCGYVMRCGECGISMTYHKAQGEAVCHFCGRRARIPDVCPQCGSKYMRHFGTGTEKVEEIAGETFPDAVIERLDLDTAKRRGSIDAILSRFGKGKTDILIGTQLVAKGLDFSNVGLVGIVAADISLNIPDFRSSERTFQLITQAAGRAGRGTDPGRVVIQSYTPEHYAIQLAAEQDYDLFYETEIRIREQIGYPPFCDILYIILAAETEEEALEGAGKIRQSFLRRVGKDHAVNILGPRPAPINKVDGQCRYQLLIKCSEENWDTYSAALWKIKNKVIKEKQKEWTLSIDVNPYGFL
ncbi:MAG: replication restart helicase PriA [Anaerovoracaceae bacterium]|jgi:primosomal protein N' (replication factor Y)